MTFTALSQRDPRWKDIKLGTSRTTTIGSHGCTITCVAIAAGTTPDVVNQKLKELGGYANTNLIVWQKIKQALGNLEFEWRGYQYDNERVAAAVSLSGFCLVEVDATRIGAPTHWVLYIGNQKMIDPWTGVIKSTNYYPPKGYAILNKIGGSMPSDDGELKKCQESYKKLEAEYSLEQQRVVDCRNERTQLQQEIDRVRDEMRRQQDDMSVRITAAEAGLKTEKEARIEQVRFLSEELGTTQNWPEIKTAVIRLVGVEDLLNKERKAHSDTKDKVNEGKQREESLKAEIERLEGELKKAKGLNDATTADLIQELINRLKKLVRRS